jgi:hypothetical protein
VKAIEVQRERSRELAEAPFKMPAEFPVPTDAQAVTRPLKGTSLSFKTALQVAEIHDYYRQILIPQGLYEHELLTTNTDDTGQVVFKGWPSGCWVVVQIVDLAYSSSEDRRVVSAELERCR